MNPLMDIYLPSPDSHRRSNEHLGDARGALNSEFLDGGLFILLDLIKH
jgi:hypothetical protein